MSDDEMLGRIDERVKYMHDAIKELEKVVLKGNGRPSLRSRVESLEAGVALKVAVVTSAGAFGTAIAAILLK
jgi:hypothetical protein